MSTLFNDKIFAMLALQAFVAKLAPIFSFARDFSSEAKAKGDAIIVPRVSGMTATTFNNDYEGTGGEAAAITVNLTSHKICPIDITDIQMVNASVAKMENFAMQAGEAVAKMVFQDILSLVTTTTFGAAFATTAATNWSLTQVRAARKTLRDREVPTEKSVLLLDVDLYDALLGSGNVSQVMQFGGNEALREARIGRLMGMDIFESGVIPLNSISLAGFVAHPDAIAVAMRYLAPPAGQYDSAMPVTHESGITLGYRRHYSTAKGKWFANFEALYGYAAGLTLGLSPILVP